MPDDRSPALLLIGHGSQSSEGVAQFWELAARVRGQSPDLMQGAGFIEWAEPALDDAIDALVNEGARAVVAVPLVLLGASHRKDDGPAALARARLRHRGVTFTYARELGVDPSVLSVAEERIRSANTSRMRATGAADHAVVLVGRGSTDPDANADLYKVARLLADSRGVAMPAASPKDAAVASRASRDAQSIDPRSSRVAPGHLSMIEPAFISLAAPSVEDALDRCELLGAKSIAVVPYFLFTGVLVDRIGAKSREWESKHSGVEVSIGKELGPDPRIVALVLERYSEAVNGRATINCDCCIHRVPLPGYEERVRAPLALTRARNC